MTQVPEVPVTGGTPCLREMTEEDLDTIARLEGELFGAEAWSRGLLNLELEASRGPQADRRYVVAESEGADDAASPSAGAGLNGPRLLGYAGLYHASGLTADNADKLKDAGMNVPGVKWVNINNGNIVVTHEDGFDADAFAAALRGANGSVSLSR